MAEMPVLLAGPIVRRVEPRSVVVWVAFREPGEVSISVWEGRLKSGGPGSVATGESPIGTGTVNTRRFGKALHIALVRTGARPQHTIPTFRPGAIYSYDIVFKPDAGGDPVGLLGMGLLSDDPQGAGNQRSIGGVSPDAPRHLALGYGGAQLPSFVTPAGILKDIRIAHTSCRKIHGPGTDALSWLDDEIKDKVDKPDERIQQLFLTGDQIYADDVPTCVLPIVHQLGLRLIGGPDHPENGVEELPLDESRMAPVTLANAPPMRRTMLIRKHGGFTSVEAQNHLLTFGEYAAMYLLAWSPRIWRGLENEDDIWRGLATEDECYEHVRTTGPWTLTKLDPLFSPSPSNEPPLPDNEFRKLVKEKNQPAFNEERQKVLVYAATVPKVARVLANTATYMIFDDHDVTDDWNINAAWRNRVYSRPLGRAVVRNALLAYTCFQAWGSDWRSFEAVGTQNFLLLAAAEEYLATAQNRSRLRASELDELFGFPPGAAQRADFHYEVPASLYQIRVLDSRTRRTYPFSVGVGAPFLLGDGAASSLDAQLPIGPRRAGMEFLLVIAATPVLGPELLERMLLPLAVQVFDAYRVIKGAEEDTAAQSDQPGRRGSSLSLASARTRGALFLDIETWPANELAQHELLNRLATYEKVLVLGGDVHYGTNLAMDWYTFDRRIGETSRKRARIIQLTASAARNAFEKRVEALYRGYHWLNQWMFGSGFSGFAWKDGARLDIPAGARLSLGRFSRMQEKPTLLPAFGWPAGTKFEADGDPDWGWRVSMLRDDRLDGERGGPFKEAAEQTATELNSVGLLPRGRERSRSIAALHAKAQSVQFDSRREVVFTNNVGLIRFDTAPSGSVLAVHTLLSTENLGYPEDEPDESLPDARPLGNAAHPSAPGAKTTVTVSLNAEGAMPSPQEVSTDG